MSCRLIAFEGSGSRDDPSCDEKSSEERERERGGEVAALCDDMVSERRREEGLLFVAIRF